MTQAARDIKVLRPKFFPLKAAAEVGAPEPMLQLVLH